MKASRKSHAFDVEERRPEADLIVKPIESRAAVARPERRTAQARSRQGQVQFAFWISEEAKAQAKMYAARERMDVQKLGEAMFNEYFAARGLARMAAE